jgi:hypothetical protein
MKLNLEIVSLAIGPTPLIRMANAAVLTTFLIVGWAYAEVEKSPTSIAQNVPKVAQEISPSLVGRTWEAEGSKFRVQFFKKNNVYNGKIVWLPPDAATKDVKNPDPKLRERNLIGSIMFQGFTFDPIKKQLTGGVVYIPEMGRILKPTLTVVGEDRIEMQISMGFMSRTVAMTALK